MHVAAAVAAAAVAADESGLCAWLTSTYLTDGIAQSDWCEPRLLRQITPENATLPMSMSRFASRRDIDSKIHSRNEWQKGVIKISDGATDSYNRARLLVFRFETGNIATYAPYEAVRLSSSMLTVLLLTRSHTTYTHNNNNNTDNCK